MHRKLSWLGRATLGLLVWAAPAAAGEPDTRVSIGVMEFTSKGGLDSGRMEALSDMLQNAIREAVHCRVLGKSDIGAVLSLEENKRLVGCDDESCMAEIGGALGVQYLVSGNLSLFGQTYLLNLKLLDVKKVEVVRGISRSITGAEDQVVAALPDAVKELIHSLKPGAAGSGAALVDVEAAEPEGTFVAPGHRKGRIPLQLDLGLALYTPSYLRGDESKSYFTNAQSTINDVCMTGRMRLSLGYNLLDWLSLKAAVGVELGSHVESDTYRRVILVDAALQLQGAFNQDSWVQPIAYLGLGVQLLYDRSGSFGEPNDSVETKGMLAELGLGVNLYLTSRLYLGLRIGGRVHGILNIGYDPPDLALSYTRIPGITGWGIGVEAAGMLGYEF